MGRYDRRKSGGRVNKGRRLALVGVGVVVIAAAVVGGVLWKPQKSQPTASSASKNSSLAQASATDISGSSDAISSASSSKKTATATQSNGQSDAPSTALASSTSQPTPPDPSTIKQLHIAQLGLVIDYANTLPGMSYSIGKTTAGTTYVQLSNTQLIGDKCTDDDGVFATILKDPTVTDSVTVSMVTKVGDVTYGLALPSGACTGNLALFNQYQASMKQDFSFLRSVLNTPQA